MAEPALVALSKIVLDQAPDPTTYLPAPTEASYPEQCLGLQLLLEYCPRLFCQGVDYWIGARLWLNAPFVHAECRADQALALQFTDDTRQFVERLSGLTGPYRARRDPILADVRGFPRVYAEGPPLGPAVTRES
ncbi:hypothetical protein B0T26DRAFT_753991 [Lasiosphaeria miniovina]|uniref:Uncharacterized protein n=1 Tax=Lasiosphaeria miniovina TaxID=1954250 RepID=A0AA40ADN9_9PEZI|nr:uncharacterized protein B0T26DRAFT_753991 [Lasiosphaeria miniovina]KAK0713935.1 hypothetical protein B0T26DRAFT_753991 [Lasiosphaeria miniovina]